MNKLSMLAVVLLLACTTPEPSVDGGVDAAVSSDAGNEDAGAPVVDAGSDAGADGGADAGPLPPATEVDLLLVVDTSNGMTQEQASLAAELPRLLRSLAAPPVTGVRVGVINADMGTGGFVIPTCVSAEFGEDGVLRTAGTGGGATCTGTFPRSVDFDPRTDDEDEVAASLACVFEGDTGGCGFEQQLEAALKALSPSTAVAGVAADYEPPVFFQGTAGQGDRANAGFLRPDAQLVVLVLTDEDDCSTRDPDVYNIDSPTYGDTDLSLRCFEYGDEALHPIARYVEGLVQLRENPSRVLFAVVVGIPGDLNPGLGAPIDWEELVGPPGTRDPRMVPTVQDSAGLAPSCAIPGRGTAFPPVRIVQTARDLEAAGARVVVQTICQTSLVGVTNAIVAALAD